MHILLSDNKSQIMATVSNTERRKGNFVGRANFSGLICQAHLQLEDSDELHEIPLILYKWANKGESIYLEVDLKMVIAPELTKWERIVRWFRIPKS